MLGLPWEAQLCTLRPLARYRIEGDVYIQILSTQKAKEAGTGGGVELTGNLGDVMKESIKIGGTFARSIAVTY